MDKTENERKRQKTITQLAAAISRQDSSRRPKTVIAADADPPPAAS